MEELTVNLGKITLMPLARKKILSQLIDIFLNQENLKIIDLF